MKRVKDFFKNIRLTSLSTSFFGISWEYLSKKDKSTESILPILSAAHPKIKVFISSICGNEKYDPIRSALKKAIEATQLATVYTFESEGASTLTAEDHYINKLIESDVCIFLIDNLDGVTPGVRKEIEAVNKYNIKPLYYFCDEQSQEPTALQKSLAGSQSVKYTIIHSFDELIQSGIHDLIADILTIYHLYCKQIFTLKSNESEDIQKFEIISAEKHSFPIISKTTLKNVDQCSNYLLNFLFRVTRFRFPGDAERTSELDSWALQFLPILLEGKSITQFNTSMYLDVLKHEQDNEYFQVVEIRWMAIQAYFDGDIDQCVKHLINALDLAKKTNQPSWVIKDISIDLRNQGLSYRKEKDEFSPLELQNELIESNEEIYYPILDRVHKSLYEQYIDGLYSDKIQSPFTVTYGNELNQLGDMLASFLIISMYNGSLTYILTFYKKLRDMLFYLSSKIDDNWSLKLSLYKLAIFARNEKEVDKLQKSYPEILSMLTSDEAVSIMDFCLNNPIKKDRLNSQLLAFGAVGYFLDDQSFKKHQSFIFGEIDKWLNSGDLDISFGHYMIRCLSGTACRLSQNTLSKICCQLLEKPYCPWYREIFQFIGNWIDLNQMDSESAQALISHINDLLTSEEGRNQIKNYPNFLSILRNQNRQLTRDMDSRIAEQLPDYYHSSYKLETTLNKELDMPRFINQYADRTKKNNELQRTNAIFFRYGSRDIATIYNILQINEIAYENETIDSLISTLMDTILISKDDLSAKLDAVSVLICIVLKYPEHYRRNQSQYQMLLEKQNEIQLEDGDLFSANIKKTALTIGLQFLFTAMGEDAYSDLLELMPYLQQNKGATLLVVNLISQYLKTTDTIRLPAKVEGIVLQNALQWIHSENLNTRYHATNILLQLSRNPENCGVINRQLVSLIDSNGVHIKNLIMRNLYSWNGITNQTREYIASKCRYDANYLVRMVCSEVEQDQRNASHS